MAKITFWLLGLLGCIFIVNSEVVGLYAQKMDSVSIGPEGSPAPLYTEKQQESFLRWTLPAEDRSYASIDGNHLHEYVKEFSDISLHYRDTGHQLWGRISGTESDVESQNWLAEKFNQIGLSNVRKQPLDLPAQWLPQSWSVAIRGNGKNLSLQTAQPTYGSPGTPSGGLDLEAVYVGLGSEADFAGRDVHGKAVFLYSIPLPSMLQHTAALEGATKRAEEKEPRQFSSYLLFQATSGRKCIHKEQKSPHSRWGWMMANPHGN